MTANELRIVLIVIGLLVLAAIYWFGRPGRARQGARSTAFERREPVIQGEEVPSFAATDSDSREGDITLEWSPEPIAGFSEREDVRLTDAHDDGRAKPGHRDDAEFDRILTLFVVAQDGDVIHGPELVVAAEKAGLVHGDRNIFHRLVDTKPEAGPIFSMANMVRPGDFDLGQIDSFTTPGVALFMTLPGPLSALDAWDAMLPSAQRLAELLDAQLLDDQRSPLGRQRIASLRDELRAYDRKREQLQIKPRW